MSGSALTLAADQAVEGRARAFAAARRHSVRVRALKVAIPLGAIAAVGLVLVATFLNPFGRLPGLTLGPLSVSGTKIAMEAPKLTGFRKDARPYEVTATAAYQDIRKPNVVELKDMRARMVIDTAGTGANLVSKGGVLDTTKEQMELRDDIRVTTDRGDSASLRSASVDFKAGTIVSHEPVEVTMPSMTIQAEGVHVSENGKTISFDGRVRAQYWREAKAEAKGPAADGKVHQAEASVR